MEAEPLDVKLAKDALNVETEFAEDIELPEDIEDMPPDAAEEREKEWTLSVTRLAGRDEAEPLTEVALDAAAEVPDVIEIVEVSLAMPK